MGISTHILDTSRGRPAGQVPITLERVIDGAFQRVGESTTNDDGRVRSLIPEPAQAEGSSRVPTGVYRATFHIADYFARRSQACFYPSVSITFSVDAAEEHYHVPLLISPFGYSTYRGS
jgi:5-hydroxyisourate hydrolase